MPKNANIREIARLSGVSTMTVSRALDEAGPSRVSQTTRKRVMKIAERLKYQPNVHARRLFSKKSHVLGLVVPLASRVEGLVTSGLLMADADTIAGATEAARKRQYYIMNIVADDAYLNEKEYLKLLRSRSIDGMLIWGVCFGEDYIYELKKETDAVVLVNTHHDNQQFNRVYADNYGGARAIANYLLNLGHRCFGYVSGPNRASIGAERNRGFLDTIHAVPGTQVHVVPGNFGFDAGRSAAVKLVRENPSITAIACANDLMAFGAMQGLKECGLSVPGDVSVTGADGRFPNLVPRLTGFAVSLFDIGFRGASALIDILEHQSDETAAPSQLTPIDLRLDVKLVVGDTSGPVAARTHADDTKY